MTYTHKNKGVCSVSTEVVLKEDGTIEEVRVLGGCNGNLKGISSLLIGMKAEDAINRLQGLKCGSRSTSCPDQIALALREALGTKQN
ncbi:MAG: TIGR03905 family TSCPD domain-containing protein [Oscillospiraceae bacterium]|nr:TIGR03905 family TSCPD domain-containing protein [Oscillospiraceae bacterium]